MSTEAHRGRPPSTASLQSPFRPHDARGDATRSRHTGPVVVAVPDEPLRRRRLPCRKPFGVECHGFP